jgi:uncharacterized protein YjbI with pentapeptide repeats
LGPGADLSFTNLSYLNLDGVNLRDNTTLFGVSSGHITGTPLLADEWKCVNGYLVGPGANLSGANLTSANLESSFLESADLTNANLLNANISRSDISGTNLRTAKLEGVKSGSVRGVGFLPPGWKLIKGYLIGKGADISKANLSGANLIGVDLTNVNIQSASLLGSKIDSKMNGKTIKGKPKNLPKGWAVVKGKLRKV